MDIRLDGKCALVTGASSGIGEAVARRLAADAAVVVNYLSINESWLHDLANRKQVLELIPSRCIGRPEDVVGAVLYLVSDEAAYVTGTTLFINGGITLYSSFLGQA